MRHKSWIIWILFGLVIGGMYSNTDLEAVPTNIYAKVQKYVSEFKSATDGNSSKKASESSSSESATSSSTSSSNSTSTSSSENATPIESNVAGKTLSNTYYYHFDKNVPQSVKEVFKKAIATYNATGLVHLVAGQGTAKQNQIKIFVYHKQIDQSQTNEVELGHGGPTVIEQTGWGAYTANHAEAGLNITYAESIKQSVATHELGHALGLAHSTLTSSVMYPIDQGHTVLTTEDINALRQIYG